MEKKKHKPLKTAERYFADLVAYRSMPKEEAYAQAYGEELTDDNRETLRRKGNTTLNRPHVLAYYNALMEDIREKQVHKAAWTMEIATEKLVRLLEHAETDLYKKAMPLTMSRAQAITQTAKELNTMYGFNQTNVNMQGCIVQFVGEDDIPD